MNIVRSARVKRSTSETFSGALGSGSTFPEWTPRASAIALIEGGMKQYHKSLGVGMVDDGNEVLSRLFSSH